MRWIRLAELFSFELNARNAKRKDRTVLDITSRAQKSRLFTGGFANDQWVEKIISQVSVLQEH